MPIEKIETCTNEFEFHQAAPAIEIHHDVTYMPVQGHVPWDQDPTWGIYNDDGELVEAAAYRRGPFLVGQSERQDLSHIQAETAPAGNYLYGGVVIFHYGHFLVSTLCRFWMATKADLKDYKIVCHGHGTPEQWFSIPFVREVLFALGLTHENLVVFDKPVRLPRLIIPRPTCQEHNFVYRAFADLGHLVGHNLLRERDIPKSDTPVWLTKLGLPSGVQGLGNEEELLNVLQREGVEIVDPAVMPMPDKVGLFARRPVLMGTTSSAFHTSILYEPGARLVCLNLYPTINSNWVMLDKANENLISYYYSPVETVEGPRAERRFDQEFRLLDPEGTAVELLRAAGL